MTAGDPVFGYQFIPTDAYLNIQPPVGVVWMIKNLYFGGGWELYRLEKEGINSILVGSGVDSGMWKNMTIIVSNDLVLAIKNISKASKGFGYDGLVVQ